MCVYCSLSNIVEHSKTGGVLHWANKLRHHFWPVNIAQIIFWCNGGVSIRQCLGTERAELGEWGTGLDEHCTLHLKTKGKTAALLLRLEVGLVVDFLMFLGHLVISFECY